MYIPGMAFLHVIGWLGLQITLMMSAPAHGQGVLASMYDCGTWLQDRSGGARKASAEAYLTGLIDGIALGTQTEIWEAGGIKITHEQASLWMDKYCRDHPLSHVIRGAFVLHEERLATMQR